MRYFVLRTVVVLAVVLTMAIAGSGCQELPPDAPKTTVSGPAPTTRKTLTDPWALELLRRCNNLECQYVESERLRQEVRTSYEQLMDAVHKQMPTDRLIDAYVKLTTQADRCNRNVALGIVEIIFFTADVTPFNGQSAPPVMSRVPALLAAWRQMAEFADSAGPESLVRANLQRTIEACSGPYGVLADECLRRHVDRQHIVEWACGDDTGLVGVRFKAGVGDSLRDQWRGWWKENQSRIEWNHYWWSFRVADADPAPEKRWDDEVRIDMSTSDTWG